ncbi:MAG: NAD(P)/FAD-dependent oxidoreductase, partial [Acidobacteriaceae bacterium]|nr:NAD(P)/FAD-dependent oxidoreductase [Acidobacteriaceae bacterium]
MKRTAVIVGSGPNGLSAGIELARAGFDVEVREAASMPGGGARSGELTLPGFIHDYGSAVYPMAVASPFFSKLRMHAHGLRWVWSPAEVAHPLDDGTAVLLYRDVTQTAAQLEGADGQAWITLFEPLVRDWKIIMSEVLRPPIHVPRHPLLLARFGLRAFQPATMLARTWFGGQRARALFAGVAAHSILKLESPLSAAFGFILGGSGHAAGWPVARGGAQTITNALSSILRSYGGRVVTEKRVTDLDELRAFDLKMLDITPRQLLQLTNGKLPGCFR